MKMETNWDKRIEGCNFTIAKRPKPVGCWCLYSTESPYVGFMMYSKPTEEQIRNTENLLGWKWKDYE
jgi:hypothetical protein